MSELLRKYYALGEYYRNLPDADSETELERCRELTAKTRALYRKMSSADLLYLQKKIGGMSGARLEPYILAAIEREQKARAQAAVSAPPTAPNELAAAAG
jgi:hypothetical protein